MKKHFLIVVKLLLFALSLILFSTTACADTLPRFMLMIEEDNTGNGNTGDSERILTQKLLEAGAEVIDSNLIQSTVDRNKAIQAISGNPQAAASIGLQFGADIMLVGRAIGKNSGTGIKNTDLKSYQATINLKAIKTDTSEIIYTGTGSAAKIHVNDITGGSLALQAAAQQIANNVIPKLLEKQKNIVQSGSTSKLQLIVGSVNEFWQVAAIKKILREDIRGVKDVVQRSFITGSAIFEIHFTGSSEQFAETLSQSKDKNLRLQIHGVSSNKVDSKLVEVEKNSSVALDTSKQSPKNKAIIVAKKEPVNQKTASPITKNDTSTTKENKVTNSTRTPESISTIAQSSKNEIDPGDSLNNKQKIQFGNYHALLIGNSKYEGIESLNTPKSDVKAVANVLSSKYGFETEFLFDASRYEMLSKLNELRSSLTKQDNLLIYYAGHGWLDEDTNEGYWLPVDSESNNPANWLSNSTITNILKSMEAKHVMIVSDSCYSGTLTRSISVKLRKPSYIQKMAQKRSRTVLASGGLEPVLDTGGTGNHSIFATAFISTLEDNNAAYIETNHLFSKIHRAVVVNSDQTPQYSDVRKAGHDGGEFIFTQGK